MNWIQELMREAAALYRDSGCDDCLATTELEEISPKVFSLVIRHDGTCPTYQAMQS